MASSRFCFSFLCFVLTFTIWASQNNAEYYYDYSDGPYGPANWGRLHPEWALCGIGISQSPVAICEAEAFLNTTNMLATFYAEASVERVYDHALELNITAGGGYISWNSQGAYEVLNIHWHTPSEHIINGRRFPLEGHIVHQGPDNKILVIGILYEYGREDEFLASILNWTSSNGTITLDDVTSNYYNYMGSLTTPPCTEDLTWIVLEEKKSISEKQRSDIYSFNKGKNSRPLQPLIGRKIFKNFQNTFTGFKES